MREPKRNIILKLEINQLARLFYRMMGYSVEEGYDFSIAKHPTEKMVWQQADASLMFWQARRRLESEPESKKESHER